jgi:opacity protein-like surface antigen
MKTSMAAAVLASSLLPTGTALAGGESGFYMGAGLGQGTIKADGASLGGNDFDGNDTAWKAIVGYNFGVVPLIDLAVEGSYVDFGKPDDGGAEVELTGWDAFGLVGVNLGPVGLFAKAGMFMWDSDIKASGISDANSDTDAAYGVGARFQLFSITGRVEFEYFDVGEVDDAYLISASALYTF